MSEELLCPRDPDIHDISETSDFRLSPLLVVNGMRVLLKEGSPFCGMAIPTTGITLQTLERETRRALHPLISSQAVSKSQAKVG